jgi:uncharacterized membrane protein
VEIVKQISGLAAAAVEFSTVAVIVIALVYCTCRFVLRTIRSESVAYTEFKTNLARTLILALEFLVAADIIRTVTMEPTLNNVAILGMLVIIRTFLSWSLAVEIEGRLPWKKEVVEKSDIE